MCKAYVVWCSYVNCYCKKLFCRHCYNVLVVNLHTIMCQVAEYNAVLCLVILCV